MTARKPRLFGVLVTYRRPGPLATMLRQLAAQDRPLDRLVVVDNDPSPANEEAAARYGDAHPVEYVAAERNVGPAGGIALGMRVLLDDAAGEDWIGTFDDDDPPTRGDLLARMEAFAHEMVAADPRTGGVGHSGGRFDWRRARIVRLGDAELDGPVPIDYVAGNQFPFYRAAAVKAVGPFEERLFFGLEELEFGLRLRTSGYSLYAHGDLWRERRGHNERTGIEVRPSARLHEASWRRYYSLRNLVFMMRKFGKPGAAVRATVVVGLAKPLVNLPLAPRAAVKQLILNVRACADGWRGRLGRTIAPAASTGAKAKHEALTTDSGAAPRQRVLVLIKGLGRGGAEQLVLSAARHRDRDRFDYEVAYLLPWKDALVPSLEAEGVRVHCLDGGRGVGWVRALRHVVRDRGIDLVHAHSPVPAAAARLALGRQTKVVSTEHNVWQRYHPATYWVNLLTFARSDHAFTVSDEATDSVGYPAPLRWLRLPPVETLYHGPDPVTLAEAGDAEGVRSELGIPEDARVVGTVANFKEHKGHEYLMHAAARVVREVPGVRFVLVGLGPREPEIRKLAADLGLADTVVFAGFREDVPRLARTFDLFVLSSIHEGLPIALLEAMALSVPVVVTRAGGIPEVVRDGVEGYLVQPRDPDALAQKIVAVLRDDELAGRLGAAGAKRADDFDIRKAVERMESVYEELLR
ncbi:MAG: glycosyltransferase [Actinomycetota bacterium]|nr:glycosyltransferase [Actinomycetota bacterium]